MICRTSLKGHEAAVSWVVPDISLYLCMSETNLFRDSRTVSAVFPEGLKSVK